MTDRQKIIPTEHRRRGRRLAVDMDLPRDKTVCFTVTETERAAIDSLSGSLGRTRSAMLTWIVTAFVEDCAAGDDPEQIMTLFRDFRAAISQSPIPPNRQ